MTVVNKQSAQSLKAYSTCRTCTEYDSLLMIWVSVFLCKLSTL